ncbi:YdbH domain-containing protein [Motilimonas cestriensis]|uniref:YdbH domain-containing protein n=1 Tax=Motilimonas cestriensis TaxID=2742685 RepID=A0ABS8WD16_9GAMM|nr:YdbH domain-containing protein [Motilimonas cestriensis]MCE2596022.1 YdbH domain-containing protein [Motilimonas cestriensis]
MNRVIKSLLLTCCTWVMLPSLGWGIDLNWLSYSSVQLARVSLDKNCPKNTLQGVELERNDAGLATLKVELLSWDLDCPGQPSVSNKQTPEQTLVALNHTLAQLNLAEWVARLPLLKVDIKSFALYQGGKPLAAPWQVTGQVTEAGVSVKLLNKQEQIALNINKRNQEFVINGLISPAWLQSPVVNLPANIALAPKLTLNGKLDNLTQFSIEFTSSLAVTPQLSKGLVTAKGQLDLARQQLTIAALSVKAAIKQDDFSASDVEWVLTKPANLSLKMADLAFEIAVKKARWRKQKLPDFRLASELRYIPLTNHLQAKFDFSTLQQIISAQVTLANQRLKWQILPSQLTLVEANKAGQGLKYLDKTQLTSGTIELEGAGDYHLGQQGGQLALSLTASNVSGLVQDYVLQNASLSVEQGYKIERNQFLSVKDNNHLSIDLLDIGVPLSAINLDFKADINQPEIRDLHAFVLGGELSVQRFKPLALGRTDVKVKGVQLSGLLAYGQLPGASATGLIDANIPLQKEADGFHIYNGEIFARAPGGQITIPDSDVVQNLATTNIGVEFIFKVLQDLRYSDLAGKLNYQPNGEMGIEVLIKGLSPQVSKTRPIEFNYSHQENLIQLLRSLRFSNELERKIEDKYL